MGIMFFVIMHIILYFSLNILPLLTECVPNAIIAIGSETLKNETKQLSVDKD